MAFESFLKITQWEREQPIRCAPVAILLVDQNGFFWYLFKTWLHTSPDLFNEWMNEVGRYCLLHVKMKWVDFLSYSSVLLILFNRFSRVFLFYFIFWSFCLLHFCYHCYVLLWLLWLLWWLYIWKCLEHLNSILWLLYAIVNDV